LWYSFGTRTNETDFQAAKSADFSSGWTRLDQSPILAINEANWSAPVGGSYILWAPDVMKRSDGQYVMYFASRDALNTSQHCIGGAIADQVAGVYHPVNDFVQCNRTSAGVIDPSWYGDDDGKQYVVYKTEVPYNWLEIREVANSGENEGVKWVDNAVKLLKVNSQGFSDGSNMEAPYIFKRGNTYFLTYSTHYTYDGTYDVQYATAQNIKGPYTRVKTKLLQTGTEYGCNLTGPGGASFQRYSVDESTVKIIFHGLTAALDVHQRVVYTGTVHVDGETLSISAT
jgi:beta-xylosidase